MAGNTTTTGKISTREIARRYKEGEPILSIVKDTRSYDTLYRALRKHNIPLRKGYRVSCNKLVQVVTTLDDAIIQQDWGEVQRAKVFLEEVIT